MTFKQWLEAVEPVELKSDYESPDQVYNPGIYPSVSFIYTKDNKMFYASGVDITHRDLVAENAELRKAYNIHPGLLMTTQSSNDNTVKR